jgi:signal transduction histidine kinase
MRGFGEALLEDYGPSLDAVAKDFTTRIVDAAEHMDGLIQDLLSYSRVSRSQLRPEPVDLGHAIALALRQNREAIDCAGAHVSNGLAGFTVLGHEQTIVQVLANLISNAVKFARPGVPASVTMGAESANGRVQFWVQDNGIGIKKEHQARIFRVFERLHGMEQYPGTGIGLAIVKKGVERMGGRSGVESRPGKGSRFWVELASA